MNNLHTKYAKFIVNELMPRAKRLNIELAAFIPAYVSFPLFYLEYSGKTTRIETRQFLDVITNIKQGHHE